MIVLLLATFDLARMQYCRATLRYAVGQATRFASTGQTVNDSSGQAQTRDASIVSMIDRLSMGIQVPHDPVQITARDGVGNVVNGSGGPGDVVTVSVTYRMTVLAPGLRSVFPGGQYTFTCSSSFRNEEFQRTAAVVAPRRALGAAA